MGGKLKIYPEISLDLARCKFQHLLSERWLNTNPKGTIHHLIRIGQITADTIVGTDHVGLAGQVPRKQQSGSNFVLVEISKQI